TKAVQESPDNATYKIDLQRAQQEAAREHIDKARKLEAQNQPDMALAEYRRALELDDNNRTLIAKTAELERAIRQKIEASRPKPQIQQLQQQARGLNQPPLLNPASPEPRDWNFNNASLKDIVNFIGNATGINITYDAQFIDKPYTVNLKGVTVEQALRDILSANGYYFKVTDPKTIIVIPDLPQKHQQYDDLVVRVFYISNADATELTMLINTIARAGGQTAPPAVFPDKASNTITVRGTVPVVDMIGRIIEANDKPRAEVLLDIQVLEVNRNRMKQYVINLSAYALNLTFSPELAPPNTAATPGTAAASPPPFNLNTISQGINTADFYLGVPTAVVNFLESDDQTKTLAKPQLLGQEGQPLTLNLGSQVPILTTVFGAAAAGGFATIPQSSYSYKDVGVNLAITPHVTYTGDILLDLSVENSAIGGNIDVGGQSAPTFTDRKVHTWLRLREGEPSLLAGLIQQNDTTTHAGFPGLMHLPVFRQLFSNNVISNQDTDIVMLITPHIVSDHDLTPADVGNIYIGTQQNIGLSGPPQLIAPQPETTPGGGTTTPAPSSGGGIPIPPNMSPGGVPGPPTGSPGGVQPTNPTPALPPGTALTPGTTAPYPAQPTGQPLATTALPANPSGAPAGATATPTTSPSIVPSQPSGAAPVPIVPAPAAPAASTTPTQIIVTPPGTEFRVAGGPYTVPISVNNASRLSTLTLTVTYNPAAIRVRTVQDGTFMRQGCVTASFTPRIDSNTGRVDIVVARAGDQTGASGAGLIAALMFDAIAPGSSTITVTGVGNAPDGTPVQLSFSPVTITVR
ncbi:MAG: secretin and TonB N-terminal domain-containing protein, partial [Vicinamibacterales bacterium]